MILPCFFHSLGERETRPLGALNLQKQVSIEATSCQKRCSQAPNMVLMPGKTQCSKIQPEAIATLLKKHYLVEEG